MAALVDLDGAAIDMNGIRHALKEKAPALC